jgi:nucleoside-diphosphate-sugar epimerase
VALFVFGLGYSARAFVQREGGRFDRIVGTVTSAAKAEALAAEGIEARVFGSDARDARIADDLRRARALLVSIPPGEEGDPTLAAYGDAIAAAPGLAWIGYLSTVGVYGDHAGAWIDEATPPKPASARSRRRLAGEETWLALGRRAAKSVQVFRLAGIYGPGRNAFVQLAAGTAKRIVKSGQVFNRIHVDDIAAALAASLDGPRAGAIYNVTDDEPAPPQDVVAYAARLAGVAPPPEIPFDEAALSPMARSFYGETKRVSNRLIKQELGLALRYPTYREGLAALRAAGEGP